MEKKEAKKKQAASAVEVQRQKKKQEDEVRNLEQLKSESENLNAREANAEKLLQSVSKFLDDGNKRMEKGIAENDIDEIQEDDWTCSRNTEESPGWIQGCPWRKEKDHWEAWRKAIQETEKEMGSCAARRN